MTHQALESQILRDKIQRIANKTIRGTEEFTSGVTTEQIRTKTFPEDALSGEPTQIGFVVNVRLIDHPGQPLVRDVLVANQARQWIADAKGIPVQLTKDKTGRLVIIGRSGWATDEFTPIDFFAIHNVDSKDLTFLYGLSQTLFQDLPANIQTGLNNFRASLNLSAFVPADILYRDPVLHLLGDEYWQGYIDAVNGVRGSSGGTLNCSQQTTLVPWNDPRWRWALSPVGFGSSAVSWGLLETKLVCTP